MIHHTATGGAGAVSAFERRYDLALKSVSGLFTCAMLVVLLLGVSSRKLGIGLPWYDEVAAILLAWLTYIGAALVALHGSHIGMDNLVVRARGALRTGLIVLRAALICLFFIVLAWHGIRVMQVMSGFNLITVPWMPVAVVQGIIPLGSALFILSEALATRRQLLGLGRYEPNEGSIE